MKTSEENHTSAKALPATLFSSIATWMHHQSQAVTLTQFLDRLYLASYTHTPTADTYFPYPAEVPLRSPNKRSVRSVDTSATSRLSRPAPCYFTVDDQLFYNAFHHDFGPFHIGHLYRFALQFHDVLGAKENQDRPIVFWSRADPRCMCNTVTLTMLAAC